MWWLRVAFPASRAWARDVGLYNETQTSAGGAGIPKHKVEESKGRLLCSLPDLFLFLPHAAWAMNICRCKNHLETMAREVTY